MQLPSPHGNRPSSVHSRGQLLGNSYHLSRSSNVLTPPVTQIEPETIEVFFIILNYVTCIPVLVGVGIFRCLLVYRDILNRLLTRI